MMNVQVVNSMGVACPRSKSPERGGGGGGGYMSRGNVT